MGVFMCLVCMTRLPHTLSTYDIPVQPNRDLIFPLYWREYKTEIELNVCDFATTFFRQLHGVELFARAYYSRFVERCLVVLMYE